MEHVFSPLHTGEPNALKVQRLHKYFTSANEAAEMHLSIHLRSFAACSLVASSVAFLSERDTDWASIRCPQDSKSTLPTPTYGDTDAVFTACTEQLISAPLELVHDALVDFSSYHLWNSFVVDVKVPPGVKTPGDVYVGMPMTFVTSGIIPLINTTSDEVVTVVDQNLPTWRSNVTGKQLLDTIWTPLTSKLSHLQPVPQRFHQAACFETGNGHTVACSPLMCIELLPRFFHS